MVCRCLRCGEFKERNEMKTKAIKEYRLVCMCVDCWKKVNKIKE